MPATKLKIFKYSYLILDFCDTVAVGDTTNFVVPDDVEFVVPDVDVDVVLLLSFLIVVDRVDEL